MKNMKWMMVVAAIALSGCASAKKQAAVEAPATPAPQAKAQLTSTASAALAELVKISCTKKTETRILEVAKKGEGCSLDYTRGGKMSSVATSSHGLKHCADTQKKIRTKLEHSGYKCA